MERNEELWCVVWTRRVERPSDDTIEQISHVRYM